MPICIIITRLVVHLPAGVLPELLPLCSLLAADSEWQRDAAGVASLIMSALSSVAASYNQQGDPVSAAILLDASLRRWGCRCERACGPCNWREGFVLPLRCVDTTHTFRPCRRRFEELAGVRASAVKATMRAADAAMERLTEEQRSVAAATRPQSEALVDRVVAALTDELGAYQQGNMVTKVQRWDDGEGALQLIGPLH